MEYNAARADLDNTPFSNNSTPFLISRPLQHQLAMATEQLVIKDLGSDQSSKWPESSNSRMSSSYTDLLMSRSQAEVTSLPGTPQYSVQESTSGIDFGFDGTASFQGSSKGASASLRNSLRSSYAVSENSCIAWHVFGGK